MNRLKAILLFVFAFAGSHARAQQAPPDIARGLNNLFAAHVAQTSGLVPGHVIRIEKPGNWIYENPAGLASLTPATNTQAGMKFKVASITKLFTSVAIYQLIQSGLVDFDAPITTYLPLSQIQGFDNYANIRVRNLLSHTSGIREPQSDFQGRLNYWIYKKPFQDIPPRLAAALELGRRAGSGQLQL